MEPSDKKQKVNHVVDTDCEAALLVLLDRWCAAEENSFDISMFTEDATSDAKRLFQVDTDIDLLNKARRGVRRLVELAGTDLQDPAWEYIKKAGIMSSEPFSQEESDE